MSLFGFFKRIFSEPEKAESTEEKLSFSDVEEFIKKKINETGDKEKEIISSINERIKFYTNELKEKLKIVEQVDIELKEKNDKIKSVTNEGRKKYIEFLNKFIDNLENASEKNKKSLEKIIENINLAFTRFNENSAKSYERATILIGKEMGNIRESLKNLSSELLTIFNENKEIISTSKKLLLIKLKLREIEETKEKSEEIEKEIDSLTKKILDKGKETREISEKINEIKKSPEYIENIGKEKNIKIEEKEIEKEIANLKQIIDFKALSNFFHIFEDKMTIIKLYREDFLLEFKKDKCSSLLKLLDESKLNNEDILKKLKQIQDKEKEIENSKKELKEDETHVLSSELQKINEEAQGFINEISWAEKKNEKFKITQEEIIKLIKNELKFLGVDLND